MRLRAYKIRVLGFRRFTLRHPKNSGAALGAFGNPCDQRRRSATGVASPGRSGAKTTGDALKYLRVHNGRKIIDDWLKRLVSACARIVVGSCDVRCEGSNDSFICKYFSDVRASPKGGLSFPFAPRWNAFQVEFPSNPFDTSSGVCLDENLPNNFCALV